MIRMNLQLFGGRGTGSQMTNNSGSNRGSLFTPPPKGYLTRREYDQELDRLASLLRRATNTRERNRVYNAMRELEKVRLV